MPRLKLMSIPLALLFSMNTYARLSCNELDELAEAVDEVAYEVDRMQESDYNRSIDRALKDLTNALRVVADYEDDRRLKAWTSNLEIAWDDMEKDDFIDSLDDITERLDELYERDCE